MAANAARFFGMMVGLGDDVGGVRRLMDFADAGSTQGGEAAFCRVVAFVED